MDFTLPKPAALVVHEPQPLLIQNRRVGSLFGKLAKSLKKDAQKAENDLHNVEKKISIAGAIKDVKSAANVVKKGVEDVEHVAFAIPRDAFISLVFLNSFGMATALAEHVATASGSQSLQSIWQTIGGNYGKLLAAIKQGAAKKPLLGLSGIRIGVAQAAAYLAAAAPIIAITGKFLSAIKPQTKALHDISIGFSAAAAGASAAGGNLTAAEQDAAQAAALAGSSYGMAQASGSIPKGVVYTAGQGLTQQSVFNSPNIKKYTPWVIGGILGLLIIKKAIA